MCQNYHILSCYLAGKCFFMLKFFFLLLRDEEFPCWLFIKFSCATVDVDDRLLLPNKWKKKKIILLFFPRFLCPGSFFPFCSPRFTSIVFAFEFVFVFKYFSHPFVWLYTWMWIWYFKYQTLNIISNIPNRENVSMRETCHIVRA